jgi:hypothetical protein
MKLKAEEVCDLQAMFQLKTKGFGGSRTVQKVGSTSQLMLEGRS